MDVTHPIIRMLRYKYGLSEAVALATVKAIRRRLGMKANEEVTELMYLNHKK
jgi:pantoate kinase